MQTSSTEFRVAVRDSILDLLWRQWTAIGITGYSNADESRVVDPEALLLLTLTVARHDARLFDAALDWLDANASFVNVQRLQNLAPKAPAPTRAALGAIAAMLGQKTSLALKWNKLESLESLGEETTLFFQTDGRAMPPPAQCDDIFRRHGLLRPLVQKRGRARPFPREGMPSLLLRLRSLLGVNIRCEILCLLGAFDEIHPSLVARLVDQAPRTTQNVMAEMARSGVVQVRTAARMKSYALVPGTLDRLLRPEGRTPWMNSVPLFRALEILWLGLSDPRQEHLDEPLLASEWRRLAREIKPLLGDAGLGQPLREDSSYPGDAYYGIFIEDIGGVLGRL
jgi:hypothetical protein